MANDKFTPTTSALFYKEKLVEVARGIINLHHARAVRVIYDDVN